MDPHQAPLELTHADLTAAVAEGIITPEQGERLTAFLQRTGQRHAILEERVAFISGFQDIFLTIGAGLVLAAAAIFGSALFSAPLAWVLAEILNRREGTRLSMAAMAGAFSASGMILAMTYNSHGPWENGFAPGLGLFLAALVFALRFRTPFTAFILAGSALLTLIDGSRLLTGLDGALWITAQIALGGALCFAAAMALDLSDRLRVTARADAAFWLHMAAAPALAHGLLGLLLLAASGRGNTGFVPMIEQGLGERPLIAVAVIAVVLVLCLVALVIDRRSLMVSTLLYFIGAVSVLVGKTGWVPKTETWSFALLLVGLFIFIVGLGWNRARGALLDRLPLDLTARLAPQ